MSKSSAIMERLDFVPRFAQRFVWVSERAKTVWAPRIKQVIDAFIAAEKLSVIEGLRDAALTPVDPIQLPKLVAELKRDGVGVYPVGIEGLVNGGYSDASVGWQPGQPFAYRALIAKHETIANVDVSLSDNRTLGKLLGYPSCCVDFFEKYYADQKFIDLTWPAAITTNPEVTEDPETHTHVVKVDGPPEANILLRWAGVRAVPHMPHSFTCEKSVDFGRQMLDLMQNHGYAEEARWIKEMLSWPIEWSALHGMLELKTPIFKLIARTDATPYEYKVQYMGTGYPDEGVYGLIFPYKAPAVKPIVETKSYKRGLEQVDSWLWRDNAFSTKEVMESAHEPIIEAAMDALADVKSPTVLDLGCGNGRLVAMLTRKRADIVPLGCDLKEEAIEHAKKLNFNHPDNFTVQNLWDFEFDRDIDLLLMMPGRILELPKGKDDERARKFFEAWESGKIKAMIVYSYQDWLDIAGGLMELTEQAGIKGHFGRLYTQNRIIRSDAALVSHETDSAVQTTSDETKKGKEKTGSGKTRRSRDRKGAGTA